MVLFQALIDEWPAIIKQRDWERIYIICVPAVEPKDELCYYLGNKLVYTYARR